MKRLKPGVDVILDILEKLKEVIPASTFITSLHHQYLERGGLSKKQLEGLLQKAGSAGCISDAKMATLQAIILKKPNRYKSEKPASVTLFEKDKTLESKIQVVLQKYPEHKRVLYFKNKYENRFVLTAGEQLELDRFFRICK